MTEPHEPIHRMVRRAAERFPEHPAIEQEKGSLTYRELLARVDGLAAALRAAGAGPGELVAVLADRPADVIVSLLAVLETGGAFVPLDPEFPAVTFPAVLGEVQPRWWLVAPGLLETAGRLRDAHRVTAELIPIAQPPGPAGAALAALERDPDALCYVYFTSGSTGRPKGIAGRLKAIDHFVRWEIAAFGVGEGTRVSQLTSPAFDAFLRDAFVPLAAGGPSACRRAGRRCSTAPGWPAGSTAAGSSCCTVPLRSSARCSPAARRRRASRPCGAS